MPEAYYDLYTDTREDNPMLIPLIHTQGQFNRMRARHGLVKKKYPDKKIAIAKIAGPAQYWRFLGTTMKPRRSTV